MIQIPASTTFVEILRGVDQPFQLHQETPESRSIKSLRPEISKAAFPLLGRARPTCGSRLPFNSHPANYHPWLDISRETSPFARTFFTHLSDILSHSIGVTGRSLCTSIVNGLLSRLQKSKKRDESLAEALTIAEANRFLFSSSHSRKIRLAAIELNYSRIVGETQEPRSRPGSK